MVARETVSLVRPDRLADYCQFARENAEAWKQADTPLHDGALPIPLDMRADLKSRATAQPRFSVTAAGKYAGEIRRLAHGIKTAQHNALARAADLMAPLIPENAVIVPMPNHEGKPVSTMILAYYISGLKDNVDIVPALEAEPHESNYQHKRRTRGKSTKIVMHRTPADIPPNRPIVLIDNVVASGATYEAAQKVLPQADLVTLGDATRGHLDDFAPSLQDLQKQIEADPQNLAASLNYALANPPAVDPAAWRSDKLRFSVTVRRALQDLADGKDKGILHNREYGDIEYNLGRLGKRGMGLAHIVESRMTKDGDTLDGAIDIAMKVAEAAESGKVTKEQYNTKHFDLDGIRAIVAFNDDGNKVITGYEISADVADGANRRSPATQSHPHVSLEEIVAALKSKLASLPTPDSIPYSVTAAQGVRGSAPSVATAPATETPAQRAAMRHSVFVGKRAVLLAAANLAKANALADVCLGDIHRGECYTIFRHSA